MFLATNFSLKSPCRKQSIFVVLPILTVACCLELALNSPKRVLASELSEATYATSIDRSIRASDLLAKGIESYELGNFSSASSLWLTAATQFAKKQDTLGQALALNNLASAYYHLGQWENSQKAIAKSLKLLEDRSTLSELPGYWEIRGKAFNTRGNWYWGTGKFELALLDWRKATESYVVANYQSGIIKSQINQAKALQALGLTVQSLKLLETIERDLQQQPDAELRVTGLRYLGIELRNSGRLARSEEVLLQGVEIAQNSQNVALLWLEIGNTRRKSGERAAAIGKEAETQQLFEGAIQAYSKVQTTEKQTSNAISIAARLNQLNLSIGQGEFDRAVELIDLINQSAIALPLSRDNIYARLNYAQSLTCLQWEAARELYCQNREFDSRLIANFRSQFVSVQNIISLLQQAIAEARSFQDKITEAQAMSQLAEVYELQQDWSKALSLTQEAILLLEGLQTPDISYSLEWQLGRILKEQGESEKAIAMYRQAIASLEQVRANILFIDRQVQFSFRDRVEPVYREFTELLLTHTEGTQPSQESLRQAIKTIDSLQLAELENFLGCELAELVKLDESNIDPTAARIYPIVLSDRLVTIMEIPGRPLYYEESIVPKSQIESSSLSLRRNLAEPGETAAILEHSQKIYQWLFAPLESTLSKNSQIKTLVFVPDSYLRNIPLGVLYDGERYLIENDFAIAVAPRLKLFAPQAAPSPLKVLTGGVGIAQVINETQFPAIEQVEQELNQIGKIINTGVPLLDGKFTEANIQQQLQTGDFSAIHWKTHGIFSSDPNETFLVAYRDRIKADELQSLVRNATNNGSNPLELLVLSACETARSDNRAVLGLAGITVRSGARSTLSTLWKAEDRATTILMTKFYQQLSQSGITKAEALRQAQLSLLREEGYSAPHFWATYLLVGSWL